MKSPRSEAGIMREIMVALSRIGVRMFRNNNGVAWVGKILDQKADYIVLGNPRPLHAGLGTGSSDLIGWTTVTVTKEMVGQRVALFTGIEVKTPRGRATPEQVNFIDQVEHAGGIGRVARSAAEAIGMLQPYCE